MLDSIVRADKKYNLQTFLKECKYAVKKKKLMNTINEELELDKSVGDKYDDKYIYPFKCKDYILTFFLIFMDLSGLLVKIRLY